MLRGPEALQQTSLLALAGEVVERYDELWNWRNAASRIICGFSERERQGEMALRGLSALEQARRHSRLVVS